MHRGRNFPQAVQHWASPDFAVQNFAPLKVKAFIEMIDHFGGFHSTTVVSSTIHVDFATGDLQWRFFPVIFDLPGDWVFFLTQHAVDEPALRYFRFDLLRGGDRVLAESLFSSAPVTDNFSWRYLGGSLPWRPLASIAVGPYSNYATIELGGLPYH